jgi:hypothetical protein
MSTDIEEFKRDLEALRRGSVEELPSYYNDPTAVQRTAEIIAAISIKRTRPQKRR